VRAKAVAMPPNGGAAGGGDGAGANAEKMDVKADVVVVGMPEPEKDEDWNQGDGWGQGGGPSIGGAGMSVGKGANDDLEWHRKLISQLMDFEETVKEKLGETGDAINTTAKDLGDKSSKLFDWWGSRAEDGDDGELTVAKEQVKKATGLEEGPEIMLKCIDGLSGKLVSRDITVRALASNAGSPHPSATERRATRTGQVERLLRSHPPQVQEGDRPEPIEYQRRETALDPPVLRRRLHRRCSAGVLVRFANLHTYKLANLRSPGVQVRLRVRVRDRRAPPACARRPGTRPRPLHCLVK
jgi:hypothetical protein